MYLKLGFGNVELIFNTTFILLFYPKSRLGTVVKEHR